MNNCWMANKAMQRTPTRRAMTFSDNQNTSTPLDARSRHIVEYRLPAKIAGWFALAIGVFGLYAASQASEDQRLLAACVSGTIFFVCLYLFR